MSDKRVKLPDEVERDFAIVGAAWAGRVGRSMPREALARIRARLEKALTPLPCGHSVAHVEQADEGTMYCRACERQKQRVVP